MKRARLEAGQNRIHPSASHTTQPSSFSHNKRRASSRARDMDEAEQQILHEYQHARARVLHEEILKAEASATTDSPPCSSSSTPPSNPPLSPPKMPVDNSKLGFHSALLTGEYSDLMITHGEQQWKAHKVIVSSQSHVLAAEIEALKDPPTLDLTSHDHQAVGYAIEYLYTANYVTTDGDSSLSLALHIRVFLLAISLGIPGLEILSASKYRQNLNQQVTDLEVYFWSVKTIYEHTTPTHPGLRVAAAEAAVTELSMLLDDKMRARFMQITHEVPDFQADIYVILLLHPSRSLDIVPELCNECGPRGPEDSYSIVMECKGCGKDKVLAFN
ncbi:uncharacterized protein BP5553_07543 [Venustampulla echinocandica]|uniref:BTB domain-containing protein n=1 Tax=Venustampulla echinocandica TaxID=2656787 RepID=A0A370TGU4_9HELO|nr:uncharacterized protein BP5553_07543 [Venustampulla echinocandica]RDL34415.1 hypothetical protein BP5553_07543 [Venustampulla echinocandica]